MTGTRSLRRRSTRRRARGCRGPGPRSVGPRATRREASTHAREHTSRARERSCVETTTPTPSSVSSAMRRVMISRLGASRPLKGSSIMTSSGRATSARATRTRWRWPPLSVPKRRVARSARLTRSRAALTRAPHVRGDAPAPAGLGDETHGDDLGGADGEGEVEVGALGNEANTRGVHLHASQTGSEQVPTTARMSVVFPPPLGPTSARA